MKPFYQFGAEFYNEMATYWMLDFWRWWARWELKRLDARVDVVQAIGGFATEFFRAADRIGALKVVDCPNSHPTTYQGFWQRECDLWNPGQDVPVTRRYLSRMNREIAEADAVIVQSNFCKESMVMNGIPAERVIVNPMGVDTSVFQKRASVPVSPRFVCVGTICLRKGHQYLFRAFEIVKQKLPQAELICVGHFKFDFRSEQKRWEGKFTHFPRLDHADLAQLLRTCTAFVFPSQEEGIARAQIEALASGLPVIGTHEGGATTLIENGREGFIVPGQNPAAIAEAMLKIASDPGLNERMSEAAFQKGAVRNTWQDYGDRLLAEYSQRLDERGTRNDRPAGGQPKRVR